MKQTRIFTIHHLLDGKGKDTEPSWPYDYTTDVAEITLEVEHFIKDPAYYLLDVFGLAKSIGDQYWGRNPQVSHLRPKPALVGESKWRDIKIGDVISDNEGNAHRISSGGNFVPLILKGGRIW
jgi:hypothetical protein